MEHNKVLDTFCDILPIMSKAAPFISSLLGSPITTVVIGLLAAIVPCDACDHEKIACNLHKDPDLYAKLERLEATHAKWLKELHKD